MKQKMKKLLREVDRKAKEREYKRDENGNIVIPLVVQDDSDFLSVFAETETPLISTDIAEYLEEKTEDIPADEPLVLRIRSSCIDPVEQEAYRKGVKEYYFTKYLANRSDLRRNTLFAVVLAATGLLILLFGALQTSLWVCAAMAIGHSFANHKTILSVVAFFLIEMAMQMIGGIGAGLIPENVFYHMEHTAVLGCILALELLTATVFYFITAYFLEKRLNLE